jgi:predicted nucleic acid-binding protein
MRAARLHGGGAVVRARRSLLAVNMIQLDDSLLDLAADIGPPILRSLDAIHLAAAWRLQPNVEIVTYDQRLGDAARAIGLPVISPGAS